MVEERSRSAAAARGQRALAVDSGGGQIRMLPHDAREHTIRARSRRGVAELRLAVRARSGAAAGREVRRDVRQSLHARLRRTGAAGRTKAAGYGLRGWSDFEEG